MIKATVEIDEDYLKELEQAQRKLQALEAHGVDNWQGYDDAMQDVWDEED